MIHSAIKFSVSCHLLVFNTLYYLSCFILIAGTVMLCTTYPRIEHYHKWSNNMTKYCAPLEKKCIWTQSPRGLYYCPSNDNSEQCKKSMFIDMMYDCFVRSASCQVNDLYYNFSSISDMNLLFLSIGRITHHIMSTGIERLYDDIISFSDSKKIRYYTADRVMGYEFSLFGMVIDYMCIDDSHTNSLALPMTGKGENLNEKLNDASTLIFLLFTFTCMLYMISTLSSLLATLF
jgi:hypothetical protein